MAGVTTVGVSDMVAGKLQEIKGKLTGNRNEVAKGKARQVQGYAKYKGKQTMGRVEDRLDRGGR